MVLREELLIPCTKVKSGTNVKTRTGSTPADAASEQSQRFSQHKKRSPRTDTPD